MNIKETKKNIIQAGHRAVEELIKVAKEAIVDSDDDISAAFVIIKTGADFTFVS